MKNRKLIIFWVLCIFLSACSVKEKNTFAELKDTHWVLEQINGQPVIEDTMPTLSFRDDHEVRGNGSCNTFFGTYLSDENTLTITGLGHTEMGCDGLLEQEIAYFAALESAKTYQIEDGKLLLIDADGNTVLVFSPKDISLEGALRDLSRSNICFA